MSIITSKKMSEYVKSAWEKCQAEDSPEAELRRLQVAEMRYEAVKRMRWVDLEAIKQQPLCGRDFDAQIDAFIAKLKEKNT